MRVSQNTRLNQIQLWMNGYFYRGCSHLPSHNLPTMRLHGTPEYLNSGVAIELPEQCTASTAHHAESDIENNAIETGGLSMEIDGRLTRELTEYAPSSQLKNSA
jgi:hypothetical protein